MMVEELFFFGFVEVWILIGDVEIFVWYGGFGLVVMFLYGYLWILVIWYCVVFLFVE